MSALAASAQGASFLILLQLSSRMLTFLINQILLRYLSPELLGLSTQLELYSITVLYFSRESVRVAVQRLPNRTQSIVNLAYLSIAIGVPLSFVLAKLYLGVGVGKVPFFAEALGVYAVGAVVELCVEPAFVAAQQKLLFKVRATSEAVATLTRCFVTCGCAIWAAREGRDLGVLPFALGQLAYASILLKLYILQMWSISSRENFSLLPKKLTSGYDQFEAFQNSFETDKTPNRPQDNYLLGLFSTALTKLSLSLFLQNSLKYILTQGDSILIASLTSLRSQGSYALASNYGGLIARMLFQPIEESSRNMFAKVCALVPSTNKPEKSGIGEAKSLLQNILRFYGIVGCVAWVLGPTLAPMLLRLVAGEKWAAGEASDVLATYCYYIPLLAVNGVTEAFVAAVATNSQLYTQSLMMGVFFAGFAGAAYFFLQTLQLGAEGLVYSNCVNMFLRILFNTWFINGYFKKNEQVSSPPLIEDQIFENKKGESLTMNDSPSTSHLHSQVQPVSQQPSSWPGSSDHQSNLHRSTYTVLPGIWLGWEPLRPVTGSYCKLLYSSIIYAAS
jgi:oligosaccharide translocation protein RFT1